MLELLRYLGRIFGEIATGELIRQHMVNFHNFRSCFSDSNETIFLNGGREDSVSFVVDMLANDIDPSWGPGDEFRSMTIYLVELVQETGVSLTDWLGIEMLDVLDGDCIKHVQINK